MVFLEFFEILLLCAQGWYKEERSKMKNSEPAEVKLELSVPILLVTSDAEVNENNKVQYSHERELLDYHGNVISDVLCVHLQFWVSPFDYMYKSCSNPQGEVIRVSNQNICKNY